MNKKCNFCITNCGNSWCSYTQMNIKKLDVYFDMAKSISKLSHDEETQVGCVLVGPNGQGILSSYNGFIKGAQDSTLPNKRPDKYQYIQHAEVNAIYQAASNGIAIKDYICICTLSPCINCLRALWQSGIKEIYFETEYKDFQNQLNMLDLKLELSKVGIYTRIKLSVSA